MTKGYEIQNMTAICGKYKHRDGAPPKTVFVLTPKVKTFCDFIRNKIATEQPKYVKAVNGVDTILDNVRYILCTSARSVRGVAKFDIIELEGATSLPDYEIIKDVHKYQFRKTRLDVTALYK